MKKFWSMVILLFLTYTTYAQEEVVFGDLRPDAPELAKRGQYAVGVQTLQLTNPDQVDILHDGVLYDRPLAVEVWYPAVVEGEASVEYEDTLGSADDPNNPLVPFTFKGRASRDAEPDSSGAPYPLLIVSHGYPGSRYMMTYLTENLASKGYVVAAIDHTESTFSDVSGFGSTLYHRPLDIRFVLDQMGDSIFAEITDTDNTGLIGYSMGGYGVISAAGGAFSKTYLPTLRQFGIPGVEHFEARSLEKDARIKAVFAFAPWGMQYHFWDQESLQNFDVPLFLVAGTEDDVSGYEKGPRAIFESATNAQRYLLTLENARHNVAPNPPPVDAVTYDQYMRYADSVWDSTRMNNIMQHFATAFFGVYLKGEDDGAYLDLIEVGAEGVYAVNEDGTFKSSHTYWAGFPPRSAVGLRFEHAAAE